MKIPSFLKQEKESLLFNTNGELIFYVPEKYFDKKYAVMNGEYITILGIFNYALFDDKGKSINGLKTFNLPTGFMTRPYDIESKKKLKLTKNSKEEDYKLLKYKKGDQVIVSTLVPKIIDNAENFFRMFIYGDLPNTINYLDLPMYFKRNLNLNDGDYGISMQLFGIIVAEQCRDLNDITKLFRYTDMKDMSAYQLIDIKQAPKFVSPYSAFTSENFDDSIVNAVLNKNTKYSSPMEKLLTSV